MKHSEDILRSMNDPKHLDSVAFRTVGDYVAMYCERPHICTEFGMRGTEQRLAAVKVSFLCDLGDETAGCLWAALFAKDVVMNRL